MIENGGKQRERKGEKGHWKYGCMTRGREGERVGRGERKEGKRKRGRKREMIK